MSESNNDWRMHLTANLSEDWKSPWTGQDAPKGSQLTVVNIEKLCSKRFDGKLAFNCFVIESGKIAIGDEVQLVRGRACVEAAPITD